MMLRKKKQPEPKEHDFTELDAAVSELSKQTAALLGTDKNQKNDKPVLPKKNTKPRSRGHSFDIIHAKPSSKAPHLKTATPKKQVTTEPQHELLPEHASLSFNESVAVTPIVQPPVEPTGPTTVAATATISGHKSGTLKPVGETTDPTEEDKPETPAHKTITLSAEEKAEIQETKSESDTGNETTLWFEDKTESEKTENKQDSEEIEPPAEEKEATNEEHSDKTGWSETGSTNDEEVENTSDTSTSYESAGVYANNLIKNKAAKRYEPRENQQKPTVFDTNEYHEELHDWSKLESHSGAKFILLLLLLVVAGGVAYFVISNQQLPF